MEGQNFEGLWQRLCRANPNLNEGSTRMTISVEQFRKHLQRAYESGVADKAAFLHQLKQLQRDKSGLGDLFDLFRT